MPFQHIRSAALIGISLIALAACAPANTAGPAASANASINAAQPAPVRAGTNQIDVKYPSTYFGIDNQKLLDLLPPDFNNTDALSRVGSQRQDIAWLRLVSVQAPKGLTVGLGRTYIEREVIRTNNDTANAEIRYYNNMHVVYSVNVPAGQATGPQRAIVTVKLPSGEEKNVPLLLSVVK